MKKKHHFQSFLFHIILICFVYYIITFKNIYNYYLSFLIQISNQILNFTYIKKIKYIMKL
jgi:hypothetical protein